jgi:hypothetical protein
MIAESVLFEFGEVRLTLIRPSEHTLLNAARYQLRVAMCRTDTQKQASRTGISEFAMILAHVQDTANFPFEIPDPLSNPEDVGLAWDCFLDCDAELWYRLVRSIGIPINAASRYLPIALEETQDFVKRGTMPPPHYR